MKITHKLFIAIFFVLNNALAQSISIESGVAGVENFKVQSNFGVSLFYEFSDSFLGELTYTQWGGKDENYRYEIDNPGIYTTISYYGNSGLNLLLLYQLIHRSRFSAYIGTGFGRYEKIIVDKNDRSHYLPHAAYSHSLLFTYSMNTRFSIYSKAVISSEFLFEYPGWGFFNCGVLIDIF